MPSHSKEKVNGGNSTKGGPLKRTGPKAEEWDQVVGPSLDSIPASQLPTVKTILQRYRAYRISNPSESTSSVAKIIAADVKAIWDRAKIPTIPLKNCVRKVVEKIELWKSVHNPGELSDKLNKDLHSLLDLAPKLRGKVTEEAQLEHLQSLMKQASDMKRRKTEGEILDWQVDYSFYLDQYNGDRVQTLGASDKKLFLHQKRKHETAQKRAKFYDNESVSAEKRLRSATEEELAEYGQDDIEYETSGAQLDTDYEPSSRQTPCDNITLTMNRKTLLRESAELATRCKVSHRVATAMTAKFVKIGGGDINQCSISPSTSHRQRTSELKIAESRIRKHFKENMPKFLIIHWDGKVIKYQHRRETDDRLAIVSSIPRADQQNHFLAAPRIPDGTGVCQRDALTNTLRTWEIPNESVIGMSWDTTASNTGQRMGSAALFEREMKRGILWLACRHHIGELHVKHADIEVRGAWNGPTDLLFEQFREHFPAIPREDLQIWNWPDTTRPHTFLVSKAFEVREFMQQHLLREAFGRDDYRELCELIIKFLGGQVIRPRQQRQDNFVMRAPGALHHARFLASCLYIMKLCMLKDVLPPGLVTPDMRTNIDRMALFISLFHGPWFLQSRLAIVAPRLDLQLWHNMCEYERVDPAIAEAVKRSILRHQWYLTESLVVFGMFDNDTDKEVRQAMANTLLQTQRPAIFPPEKPKFPTDTLRREATAELPHFIGPRSWLLFDLVNADGLAWLSTPPNQWETNQEYKEMLEIVNNLAVVNDAAERGVKDIQDYANAARDGSSRERIVLVSNSHRIKLPNFLKNEMEENL